jgi:methylglutaconyl-CoA hydratase
VNYQFLELQKENKVVTVMLNRPDLHNAFNAQLIAELTDVFKMLGNDHNCQVIILTGAGKSFCAGADLNWMKSMVSYSMEENIQDSQKLASMFHAINNCPKTVIGKINGAALGGGVGLLAVCDYVVTTTEAKMGFTEVRLGLIPAVISPFCIAKIGESNARAWFMSGERFDALTAKQMGLVHEVVEKADLDQAVLKVVKSHLQAAPQAMMAAKELIQDVITCEKRNVTNLTCEAIAKKRVSPEGQEGMQALLNKTNASWME